MRKGTLGDRSGFAMVELMAFIIIAAGIVAVICAFFRNFLIFL